MSSEAITRNDLSTILNGVIHGKPSEFRKLLWENTNITGSFAPQTLSINLSGYDRVSVEWAHNINTSAAIADRFFNDCLIGETGDLFITRTDSWLTQMRSFSATTNGVTFGDCKLGSSATVYNNHCVPTRIYGIKYERVSPPQVEYPNYSTEEQQVGTWATGKPLYRKVFQYASMPNNTTATYAHNISNMDIVVRYTCCWWDSNDGRFLMSPRDDSSTIKVRCSINKTNIIFEATGTNWSTRTSNVNVIVEYTKTTD